MEHLKENLTFARYYERVGLQGPWVTLSSTFAVNSQIIPARQLCALSAASHRVCTSPPKSSFEDLSYKHLTIFIRSLTGTVPPTHTADFVLLTTATVTNYAPFASESYIIFRLLLPIPNPRIAPAVLFTKPAAPNANRRRWTAPFVAPATSRNVGSVCCKFARRFSASSIASERLEESFIVHYFVGNLVAEAYVVNHIRQKTAIRLLELTSCFWHAFLHAWDHV